MQDGTIIRNTIGEAHDAIMQHLIELWKIQDENEIVTEDNERTIESPGMKVRVLSPWKEPKTSPALEFGPRALETYVNELVGITPITGTIKDFEYTYGNRLWDYPVKTADLHWKGDGRGGGIPQITQSIIDRLIANPTSRRAIAVTWVVEKDIISREPPCLQFVQCLIRDGKLNFHAVFRSHDMALGWGPNTFALESLQRRIIKEINEYPETVQYGGIIDQGYIETYSVSAHIYTLQDQVQKFRGRLRI